MRAPAWLIVIALVLALAPALGAKPKARLTSPESILRWINEYRHAPEPGRLPEAVRAMSKAGIFRDPEAAGVYIGFTAGVLGANPLKAEAYLTAMFPFPPEEQAVIVRAIAYSGLPGWKELLTKFAERMPARRVLIDRHLFGQAKGLMELPLEQGPAPLDMLWGYYFASGSEAPVLRLMTALAWANEKKDVEKLTAAGMAKWTLATNATRNADLLDICRRQLALQPKEVRPALKEVVEAVELAETARIRRDAVAAIEELKRRAPPKGEAQPWTWAYAAQMTSTAIAVGCVVAGATGHVELGLPCIVSGALTQGAARVLSAQP